MGLIMTITKFEMKRNLKDIMTLIMFIGFPLLLILILGNTVGELMVTDIEIINKLAVYSSDENAFTDSFFEFLDQEEVHRFIQYEKVLSEDEAILKGQKEEYQGYILIPKDTFTKVLENGSGNIVYFAKENESVIEGVLNGFVETTNVIMTLTNEGFEPIINSGENYIQREVFNKKRIFPKAIDYYGVLSLIQMLGFATILGSNSLGRDYTNDAFIRIKIAPANKNYILLGKILGNSLYILIAAATTMIIARFVLGVTYGGNFFISLLGLTLYIFIMVGVGIIIGSITKNLTASIGISIVIMMFLSTVSGSITPMATNVLLQRLTPNYYVKMIMFGQNYGYPNRIIIDSFIVLCGILIVVYMIGIYIQRRKEG